MSMTEFMQQVAAAVAKYFPGVKPNLDERRGMELRGRIAVDDDTLIDVYYSAATGKTSYALVRKGKRIFGYDNFRGWHYHPAENPDEHIACQEPTPDGVLREMNQVLSRK